ncbi:MAG: alpha/beta hydrolase [Chloroflexi bacterium]|nr:alpha/beta hydrolase [Chloroflexota bacterium]
MNRTVKVLAYVLVTLAILLAVVPLLIPVEPAPNTRPLEELVDPDSQYIDARGVKIYYRQSGVNEPVFILLHGLGGSTYSWRAVFDDFASQGTVIAYDRPAFGLTERPLPGEWGDENPYSNEAQLEQLWALMDTLGVQKAILVGHSAGGAVAIQAALEHPERVESLILVDAAVYSSMSAPAWVRKLFNLRQVDRLGPLFIRLVSGRAGKLLERAWHDPSLMTQDIVEGYFRPFQVDNWDTALWELVKARSNPQIKPRLEELSLPVLVITGDDDHVIPIWQSQRLAKAIPDARLVVIENCGHIPQEECPEEFLSAVEAFLVK